MNSCTPFFLQLVTAICHLVNFGWIVGAVQHSSAPSKLLRNELGSDFDQQLSTDITFKAKDQEQGLSSLMATSQKHNNDDKIAEEIASRVKQQEMTLGGSQSVVSAGTALVKGNNDDKIAADIFSKVKQQEMALGVSRSVKSAGTAPLYAQTRPADLSIRTAVSSGPSNDSHGNGTNGTQNGTTTTTTHIHYGLDLLHNGGFEDGPFPSEGSCNKAQIPTGWNAPLGEVYMVNDNCTDFAAARLRNHSKHFVALLKLSNTTLDTTLEQTIIGLRPGKEYWVTYMTAAAIGYGPRQKLRASVVQDVFGVGNVVKDTEDIDPDFHQWKYLGMHFTSSASSAVLKFENISPDIGEHIVYIDTVAVWDHATGAPDGIYVEPPTTTTTSTTTAEPAPFDCQWNEWSPWGGCDVSCGGGVNIKNRTFTPPQRGGKACDPDGGVFSLPCNEFPCPVDCVWEEWTDWGECTDTCGPDGLREQTRGYVAKAAHGGMECTGTGSVSENCNRNITCPLHCQWFPWSEWSDCSYTCGFEGIHYRNRTLEVVPPGGMSKCEGKPDEIANCSRFECPIDCVMADWTPWSMCSLSCGTGHHERNRTVISWPEYGGVECSDILNQTEECNDFHCPIDCVWSDWSEWGGCSTSCIAEAGGDPGIKIKDRYFAVNASYGGHECVGNFTENTTCNEFRCPIDCVYGPWSEWTVCSETCAGVPPWGNTVGSHSRYRHPAPHQDFGGVHCEGPEHETEHCNTFDCPIDCIWYDWDPWTDCTKTCGVGQHRTQRTHNISAANGGAECTGPWDEVAECNGDVECPIDCVWSQWTLWEDCSHTCGFEGSQHRARDITLNATYGGVNCTGPGNETRECNRFDCPVSCVWTAWTEWSECTATCGINGESTRNRSFVDPNTPRFGGAVCQGGFTETLACNQDVVCPHTTPAPNSSNNTNGSAASALPVVSKPKNAMERLMDRVNAGISKSIKTGTAAAAGEEASAAATITGEVGAAVAAAGAIMAEKGSVESPRTKASEGHRAGYVHANGVASEP